MDGVEDYVVMRDRNAYHLFFQGKWLESFKSHQAAQEHADLHRRQCQAMTEADEARTRLKKFAAEKMRPSHPSNRSQ